MLIFIVLLILATANQTQAACTKNQFFIQLLRDSDGDGYIASQTPVQKCFEKNKPYPSDAELRALGFRRDSGYGIDCNDKDPNAWSKLSYQYVDMDGDGYTLPKKGTLCTRSQLPSQYLTNAHLGLDCNDKDPSVFKKFQYKFVDMDGDGYTVPKSGSLCISNQIPKGYLENSGLGKDCNDNPAKNGALAQVLVKGKCEASSNFKSTISPTITNPPQTTTASSINIITNPVIPNQNNTIPLPVNSSNYFCYMDSVSRQCECVDSRAKIPSCYTINNSWKFNSLTKCSIKAPSTSVVVCGETSTIYDFENNPVTVLPGSSDSEDEVTLLPSSDSQHPANDPMNSDEVEEIRRAIIPVCANPVIVIDDSFFKINPKDYDIIYQACRIPAKGMFGPNGQQMYLEEYTMNKDQATDYCTRLSNIRRSAENLLQDCEWPRHRFRADELYSECLDICIFPNVSDNVETDEICGNHIDDDKDGYVDEFPCK